MHTVGHRIPPSPSYLGGEGEGGMPKDCAGREEVGLVKLGHVCSWEGVAKAYASELPLCHFYCAVVVEGQGTLVELKVRVGFLVYVI